MKVDGHLKKMAAELAAPVKYTLNLGDTAIDMNALLGQSIQLEFLNQIKCTACGRATKKSFSQGHCFPCFRSLASCDRCIMSPEHCHFSAGTCREPEWGEQHCMVPHIVYLANSSGAKVGITRQTQVPTRWIDQGAIQAMPIFSVQSRLDSGLIEVILKQHVSDRTNWRNMLKNCVEPLDLNAKKEELVAAVNQDLQGLDAQGIIFNPLDEACVDISYPVLQYPEKIRSLSFDKQAEVSGTLQGIKGQYLLLDTGVINLRKFTGYHIQLTA